MATMVKSSYRDSLAIFRVEIAGTWTAGEFAELLSKLQDLYGFQFLLHRMLERRHLIPLLSGTTAPEQSTSLSDRIQLTIPQLLRSPTVHAFVQPRELDLTIKRLSYGSPGISDLAGVGEIVGHVKDLLLRLLELGTTREERKEKTRAMRIENARSTVALAKEMGYSNEQIQKMVRWVDERQKPVFEFARQEKLTGINVIPEETER